MNPIYSTDNYPRVDCQVVIDFQASGYCMSIVEPEGKIIETYSAIKSARALSRMLEEWCNGYAPMSHHRLDQSPSGSEVTE